LAANVEDELAAGRHEGARHADEIRRRAEADEQSIQGRHRDQALALLERERATTNAQVAAARAPLRADADRLAATVVTKVLGRPA